jgi:hypothetical protein
LTVSTGATLDIDGGASLRNYGGLLSNSGTINVNHGELGIVRAATNAASRQISAPCASILYISGGTISGNPPHLLAIAPRLPPPRPNRLQPTPAGWNTSDVTVTWNWTDPDGAADIDSSQCTSSSTSSGEGTLKLTANCEDKAGNQGSGSYTVKVDKTPPTISAAAATLPNGNNGWYTSPVTADFTARTRCPRWQLAPPRGR